MLTAFLLGALGGLIAEIIKRWDQFGRMSEAKFRSLWRSLKTWAAVLVLIVAGGMGGIFCYQEAPAATWQLLFFTGAGMMLSVRNVLSAAASHAPDHLGVRSTKGIVQDVKLRDIFN
jgi:hypothetical protein